MIAVVSGVLGGRDGDSVLIQTDGGVGYEISVPLGVLERLPAQGSRCSLFTELVVREDGWTLFGFDRRGDRLIFQRLLGASGFGPRLALALVSSLGPDRTVRAIQSKDVAALSTVPGIGRKKAERLILELSDKFEDVVTTPGASVRGSPAAEAAKALGSLGYPGAQADDAIREAITAEGDADAPTLIKRALRILTTPKGGR